MWPLVLRVVSFFINHMEHTTMRSLVTYRHAIMLCLVGTLVSTMWADQQDFARMWMGVVMQVLAPIVALVERVAQSGDFRGVRS